ncbi:MAG: hypothetical protein CMN77_13555 [Spirochaetaceae bacterium]|nr:hypothetical protein [Spirochaetaceae bacterium]|tara:strand:+ start:2246 stop:2680 length:435 start_codon:yes stop_codon:yes gene_type:complete
MKKLWISLLILPFLAACPGEGGGDDSLTGLLLLQGLSGECESTSQAPSLGETVTMTGTTSSAALRPFVPTGATSVTLKNTSNSENNPMYPEYRNANCEKISDEPSNTTVVGNTKAYTLPEGTTQVFFRFDGDAVSSYSAEATFN